MTLKPSDEVIKVYKIRAERIDELGDNYICGVYSSLNKATDKLKKMPASVDYEYYIDEEYVNHANLQFNLDE